MNIEWPKSFLDKLISGDEQKDRKREGRKDQKVLNGIEAQTAVVNAGAEFWQQAMKWGLEHNLLTEREAGVLKVASRIPQKIPTEKQVLLVIQTFSRLQEEGLDMSLESSPS